MSKISVDPKRNIETEAHSINVSSEAEFQRVNQNKTTTQNSTEVLLSTPDKIQTPADRMTTAEELDVTISIDDLSKY